MAKQNQTRKKKIKKVVPWIYIYIHSTFNNTIITATETTNGEVLFWSSSGCLGFKGARKSTPYAAQLVAKSMVKKAKEFGVQTITIKINGIGPGKDASIKQFQASDITVKEVQNITKRPHNGTKPKKKFRR